MRFHVFPRSWQGYQDSCHWVDSSPETQEFTRLSKIVPKIHEFSRLLSRVSRTSRERHKSAPYLRLKNSKRTFNCQVTFYSSPKTQKLDRADALKEGTLSDFSTSILLQNIKQIEGEPFGDIKIFRKQNLQFLLRNESFWLLIFKAFSE